MMSKDLFELMRLEDEVFQVSLTMPDVRLRKLERHVFFVAKLMVEIPLEVFVIHRFAEIEWNRTMTK